MVHSKLSLLISVGGETDRGGAVVCVPTNYLPLRHFEMPFLIPIDKNTILDFRLWNSLNTNYI
jgi:hypothetical protein